MHEKGSTLVELAIVGPLLTLIGTIILQYALIFQAKNLVNHAGFMATREGSKAHAELPAIHAAYVRALIPLYGGGDDADSLSASHQKALADTMGHVRIELLNPTRAGFDDWADPYLNQAYGGRRAMNQSKLIWSDDSTGHASGQNRRDAHLIQLRITHGYELKVPLASTVMQFLMRWNDNGSDGFVSDLLQKRRLPIVMHATMNMLSDAIEQTETVFMPGAILSSTPSPVQVLNPDRTQPPMCLTAGCTVIMRPGHDTGSGDAGGLRPDDLYSCPPGDPSCSLLCTGS